MTPACVTPRDPDECADGYLDVLERLSTAFDVVVVHRPLGELVARWDGPRRELQVNADRPLEDQLWALLEAWKLLAIGPDATCARRRPCEKFVLHTVQ